MLLNLLMLTQEWWQVGLPAVLEIQNQPQKSEEGLSSVGSYLSRKIRPNSRETSVEQ